MERRHDQRVQPEYHNVHRKQPQTTYPSVSDHQIGSAPMLASVRREKVTLYDLEDNDDLAGGMEALELIDDVDDSSFLQSRDETGHNQALSSSSSQKLDLLRKQVDNLSRSKKSTSRPIRHPSSSGGHQSSAQRSNIASSVDVAGIALPAPTRSVAADLADEELSLLKLCEMSPYLSDF